MRAAQTAEIVAERLGVPVGEDERLAGEVEHRDARGRSCAMPGDPARPVIVGHDPDFSELVALLCGAARVPMRKGALARIDVSRPLEPGGGTLRWLVPPDLLRPDR